MTVKKFPSSISPNNPYSLRPSRRMKSINNLSCHPSERLKLNKKTTFSPVEVNPKILKLVEGLPTLEETRDAWGYLHKTGDNVLTLDRKLNDGLDAGKVAGYVVGSDESCDIRTKYGDAPKRHALIYASPRIQDKKHAFGVFIQDLSTKSLDGVWVNYQKIGKNVYELASKDIIHFRDPFKFTSSKKLNHSYTFIKPIKTSLSFQSLNQLYCTIKSIGSGSFGVVYLAACKTTGRRVAIKEVPLPKDPNVNKRRSLLREISVCMALPPHPCIIQTNKVFEENNKIYFVMEYGNSGDLFSTVAEPTDDDSTLREFEVKIIFEQIAHAISYLHEHGVVHRDIKMENVVICDRKKLRAKLCDFGFSTFSKQDESLYSVCGTTMYAAPELIKSTQGYGMEVDIWSLGVLLYSALTNSMPFTQMDIDNEENKSILRSHILKGDFNFNHPAWKEISEEAKDLVKRMMEMNAKERYTISQVLEHPWLQNIENELTRESGVYRNHEMVEYLARRNNSSCFSF